jgi:hypothetical protein
MATTIIAIYGAVLATLSTLLGAWYYLHSGPRLQAEAIARYPLDEDDDDWPVDESFIVLHVWNTGRTEITVSFLWMTFHHGKSLMSIPRSNIDYDSPEEPTWIPGHSAEVWFIDHLDIKTPVTTSGTLRIKLEVGGKREIDVPVLDGMIGRKRKRRRPFILDTDPSKSKGFLSRPDVTPRRKTMFSRRRRP